MMLQTIAKTGNLLSKDTDDWIGHAVRYVMTDPWQRTWLAERPGMEFVSAMPRKQGSALLWALYDKDMPKAQDFFNAGLAGVGLATRRDMGDENAQPPAKLDFSQVGDAIGHSYDAYARYGVTRDQWLNNALHDPDFLKDVLSARLLARFEPNPETDAIGGDHDKEIHEATKVVLAALPMLVGGEFEEDDDDIDDEDGDSDLSGGDGEGSSGSLSDGASDDESTDSDIDNLDHERDLDEDYIQVPDEMHGHHPWPKYMGGAEDQELYYIPKVLHDDYHYEMREVAPTWLDYKNTDDDELMEIYQDFADATKEYDEINKTKFYEYLMRNNFPAR